MLNSHIFSIVSATTFIVPYKICNVVFLTEYFITNFSEIGHFYFIYTDKNHPIVPQQIRCQPETRIHHIQPVCVKAAHGLRIRFRSLLRDLFVARHGVGKIVLIDKVVARIVRWIDINHLHAPEIGGLQQLEHLQIVALYVQVLRFVKVDAFLFAGAQCAGGTPLGKLQTLGFALPLKLVLFKIIGNIFAAHCQQLVDIQLSLRKAVGEYRAQPFPRFLLQIHALSVQFQLTHFIRSLSLNYK